VTTPPPPLPGISEDSKYLSEVLSGSAGPVMLVGSGERHPRRAAGDVVKVLLAADSFGVKVRYAEVAPASARCGSTH